MDRVGIGLEERREREREEAKEGKEGSLASGWISFRLVPLMSLMRGAGPLLPF